MPATFINGSPNIASLNSIISADLCQGKFFMDISNTLYIGSGESNVLGAKFKITNPSNVIVKQYPGTYEVAPSFSGGMDAVISFNIPTQAGNFQYGEYIVEAQITDADGSTYIVSKPVSLCEPDQNNKTRNYGTVSATMKGSCRNGRFSVIVNSVPTYRGKISDSQVNDFTLLYPTVSGINPLDSIVTNFTVALFEGVYKLSGTICASYNLGDSVSIKISYHLKCEHDQKCIVDLCCVNDRFTALRQQLQLECSQDKKDEISATIVEALFYLENAKLSADCGEDPSDAISQLETLLGCSCICNTNEGVPIIDLTPSQDIIIDGCGFTKTSVGSTDTYVLNNYTYIVDIAANGGALTITEATGVDCIKTQVITFNIAAVYSQIKAQINNPTEYNLWAGFINKTLNGVDATCIGFSTAQWAILSFRQRFEALIAKFCKCCGCDAELSNVTAVQNGQDIVFTWDENLSVSSIDIYWGDILVANVLSGVGIYNFFLDRSLVRAYTLIPYCSNGATGIAVYGDVDVITGVYIVPPSVYTNHLVGVCPYNLNTNVLPLPLGITSEWHTANNTSAKSLVADPTQAIQSAYYLFGKDSNNFYSDGVPVTLVCDSTGSCSAPQNLSIVSGFGGNIVQFQSASYPPPSNSYTVKRRLKSSSDIPGNYTTLGSPVWNGSASRWQIADPSAVNNVLYVYRAFSNCGTTMPYIDKDYASIVCPALTLTPLVTEVDYSFVNSGGEIDKYEVNIYEADQVTLVHTNTHVPAFSNPITGIFNYLNSVHNYYVGITAYIGVYSKTCQLKNIQTLDSDVTLTVDYIAGEWSAVISAVLPSALTLSGATVSGGSASDCSSSTENDTMPSMSIPSGKLFAKNSTDGLTYLSTYYSIANGVNISGIGAKVDGDTFVKDGVNITVVINHIDCNYYPA